MNIENLFVKKIATDENFDYKILYNDTRGAVFKDEYKSLIRQAIEKRVITIDTFIVAENVQEELYTISEIKGFEYNLINCLKNHHNEADFRVASLIYLLKKLDPAFTLNDRGGKLQIISDLFEVELCPRIDGKNAEPRIFFPKEKIAITSTNDDVENLGDILAVKDVKVYALGTDDRSNVIYAYKVSRDDSFFDVAEGYKENLKSDLFNNIRK
ncbi:hypothetical protein BMG_6201 (plasmid) [Priestia megaterium]|uniref:hypothetical protein n=1 Tax=Priestia megaterium TaxID=1404 RepID=UPI0015DC4F9C|nr:hypothetical protein [Priestia megaterium]QLK09426.1 hypothetical protein BMG_6201 [Priestia megaterium]